jgi:hypothetical protein
LSGKLIHHGIEYPAVETRRGRENDEQGFRPVCNHTVEALGFRPYGLPRDLENRLAIAADWFAREFFRENAVHHQAVVAADKDGSIGHVCFNLLPFEIVASTCKTMISYLLLVSLSKREQIVKRRKKDMRRVCRLIIAAINN